MLVVGYRQVPRLTVGVVWGPWPVVGVLHQDRDHSGQVCGRGVVVGIAYSGSQDSRCKIWNLNLQKSQTCLPICCRLQCCQERGWRLAERWRRFSPRSKNVSGWTAAFLLPGVGVSFVFPKVARLDCTGGVEEAALSCKDDSKRSIFPSSPTRLLDRTLAQSLSFIFRLKTISDKNWQSKHLKRRFNGACPWCARSFWVGKGRRERQPFSGLTCTRVQWPKTAQTLVCGNIQNNFPFWQSDYRAIGNWLYNLSRVFPSQLFCRTTGRSACTLMLLLQTCKNFQIFQVGFLQSKYLNI